MWHRKHTYMRLDGSSKISDRRDMVADFQARSDIFAFLLSTRAGGLGINLTAADTVSLLTSTRTPPETKKVWFRLFSGDFLWQWLEPNCGSAGHGQSPPSGPDQAGDCVPTDLQGNHWGEDSAACQGEEWG